MSNKESLPEWLLEIEGYVRQFQELREIESKLNPMLCVNSTKETTTHMGVRLAMEREIQSRKDYLAEIIALHVVEHFNQCNL